MLVLKRFEIIRKETELGIIRKDILTGCAKGKKEDNKSYAVALAGVEMTGTFSKKEVKDFEKRILDLMQKVEVYSNRVVVFSKQYEKPLMEIWAGECNIDKNFTKCLINEHVLCVEYRVFIRSVQHFLDQKFGSKFKTQKEVDEEVAKIKSGLLFATGGVWNLKDGSWLIRPSIGDVEFWN